MNPASLADNHDKIVISFLGINAGIDNSLGKINSIPAIRKFIKDDNANVNDVFTYSNKTKFSLLAPYTEVRGPGIMVNVHRKHTIAFSTRLRGANQFNNFDQTLYKAILDTGSVSKGDIHLQAQNFNWTAQSWYEAALSWGGIVFEKGNHQIKAGVTVRYLAGIGYIGLKGSNLDANYIKDRDSFYANHTDVHYSSNVLTAQNAIGISNSNFFSQFLGKAQGRGIGADLGVVYDYITDTNADRYDMDGQTNLPNPNVNRYKIRVSASVTDIGNIFYKGNKNYGLNVTGNGGFTGKDLSDNVKTFEDFKKYALGHGFNADTGHADTRLYMPATLILSADYHAWKQIYVNGTFITNLANRQNFGNSVYGQFTVTPRYDTRRYSVGLPITYSALTTNMKIGLGLRYKGFFLGSDDMLVVFAKHQYGMNFYAGGFLTLHNRMPKDRDGDHISDCKDRCPDEAGDWRNHGCPLKEGKDKLNDTTDNCPEAQGLSAPETQVEKDTDGDGIPDSEDACPTVAGVASNHGCPEKKTLRSNK